MFKSLSKAIGIAGYVMQYGCITHCTFEYIGDFVVCNGPSMEPTLRSNNILITERITPRLCRIQRGDIIIAKCPTNPTQHICKRVVGLPGDRIVSVEPAIHYNMIPSPPPSSADAIEFENIKKVENNSATDRNHNNNIDIPTIQLEENPILIPLETIKKIQRPTEIIVPRGHVWIEGDNSENSSDSRYYGPIPQGLIKSRAICRLWPLSEIKSLLT